MRVAIVTETFLPKMDGIVRMLTEFLGHLRGHGHDALVIAPGAGPSEYAGFPVRRLRGVRWHVYPGLTLASPAPRQIAAALRDWRPDIVHLAGPVLLGSQAALVARTLGLPLAAHFQTDLASYTTWHGVPFLHRAAWSYLRTVHRLADRTYCPTPTVRRQLQGEGFRDLALCGRGVNTTLFQPARRSAAYRATLLGPDADPATPILAYVGRLSPEKNLAALVTIAEARPELPLLIVGDGPARPWLEQALAGRRAHFAGELRGEDLATAYASADFLACTSLTETFCQVAQGGDGLGVAGHRLPGGRRLRCRGARRGGFPLPTRRRRGVARGGGSPRDRRTVAPRPQPPRPRHRRAADLGRGLRASAGRVRRDRPHAPGGRRGTGATFRRGRHQAWRRRVARRFRVGKADLHLHTTYSDGAITVRALLDRVATRGELAVVAITDHDTIAGAEAAQQLAQRERYPVEVIVGEEVTTRQGHIVGLFLREAIPPGQSAVDTVAAIHRQGGLAFAPHPFFNDRPLRQRRDGQHRPPRRHLAARRHRGG